MLGHVIIMVQWENGTGVFKDHFGDLSNLVGRIEIGGQVGYHRFSHMAGKVNCDSVI
jgi:hypothetical protein